MRGPSVWFALSEQGQARLSSGGCRVLSQAGFLTAAGHSWPSCTASALPAGLSTAQSCSDLLLLLSNSPLLVVRAWP